MTGVIARYRSRLPVPDEVPVVTLGEGSTPLLPAPVLSGLTSCQVYLKVEGGNPTGSFKDRGMTVAVTLAAALALVLPVDAQMTARAPAPTAMLSATVMPRSLNEPVGLPPSTLR